MADDSAQGTVKRETMMLVIGLVTAVLTVGSVVAGVTFFIATSRAQIAHNRADLDRVIQGLDNLREAVAVASDDRYRRAEAQADNKELREAIEKVDRRIDRLHGARP